MKIIYLLCALAASVFSVNAVAGCANNTKVTGAALTALVSGKTVCASNVGGDRWQEEHLANQDLYDYKKGPSDPVDPREKVGTWGINGNNVVYNYTGGSSYTYSIHTNGVGVYSYCNGAVEVVSNATFRASPPCP